MPVIMKRQTRLYEFVAPLKTRVKIARTAPDQVEKDTDTDSDFRG